MKKEQFDITGMTCSACSTRVEQCVAKLPGVAEVSVNLLKNSMAVSYDEGALDSAAIAAAVENAGYGAIPKASARSGKETKPEVSTAQAEYNAMKQRLFLSALFTVPLFYISMGHMMNWSLPVWLLGIHLQHHRYSHRCGRILSPLRMETQPHDRHLRHELQFSFRGEQCSAAEMVQAKAYY